jgi:glycosyltransferase involved in cell wall biosynthesis
VEPPVIQGRDVVILSSIDWDHQHQGHQEVARRLAQAGNRVLYVENTGIRSPGVRDARRVARRLGRALRGRLSSTREVEPDLFVCSPLVLPPFGSASRRWVNRALLLPVVARSARSLGFNSPVVWTYLPTDTALDLVGMLRGPGSVVAYYCVADFAELASDPAGLEVSEARMVRASDLVFAHCEELARRCARHGREVHVFPSGVNMDAFPVSTLGESPELGMARPVIGYVGGVHRHIDFDLLAAAARLRPDWSWVLVGPRRTSTEPLEHLPNVRLVGHRPHRELAAWIAGFDVCLVPFVCSSFTETMVPTKINEYLAMGKPVVATDLAAMREFNDQHNVLSLVPAQVDLFLAAIEQALGGSSTADELARRRVAATREWGRQLEAMSELITAQPASS